MNIIICGAGRVGFTISKILSEQNHSITVIDQSSEDIQKINENLDVKAIVGKATYPSILEKANAPETDMIIAVTRNDEINMLICQIAFSIFNIPKKIARIRSQDYLNPKFTRVYNKENLPIDVIISPEIEIAKSIQRKLEACDPDLKAKSSRTSMLFSRTNTLLSIPMLLTIVAAQNLY